MFFSAGEAEEVKKGKKTRKVHQRRYYMLDTEKPGKIHGFPFFDQHTNQKHPMVDGTKLYFKIHEGPERYEILRIDTAAARPKVEVIGDGSEGFSDCLTIIGDKMYFRGFDGPENIGNKELWSVDLTQPAKRAVLVEEICPVPRAPSHSPLLRWRENSTSMHAKMEPIRTSWSSTRRQRLHPVTCPTARTLPS